MFLFSRRRPRNVPRFQTHVQNYCFPRERFVWWRSRWRRHRNFWTLHGPVTWYKIRHAGTQVAQWKFHNKGRSRWTGTTCFVLEVPRLWDWLSTYVWSFTMWPGRAKGLLADDVNAKAMMRRTMVLLVRFCNLFFYFVVIPVKRKMSTFCVF